MFERVKNFFGGEKQQIAPGVTSAGLFGTSSRPPRRGTTELISVYNDSPWLRAVVHKVGQGVAETQWRLFVARTGGGKAMRYVGAQRAPRTARRQMLESVVRRPTVDIDVVQEVVDHPLLDLLSMGNGELLGYSALQVTQVHLDLAGEAFWVKERNAAGMPVAFWPIPPDWVRELPTRDNPFYRISASAGTLTNVEVPVTEVLYFRDPNPSNPYGRGSGAARALADEIEIDEFAAKHLKSFFFNRARPDVIISGENISREDAKRLELQWREQHQGFWNAFKPLFFSRSIDVSPLSQSFESMQMVELRKQERDAFINVFGVPPEKLGVIGESKRSTIAAADFFWTKDIIVPRVEMLRNFLQWKLVPDFDARLILDYDTPIVQDEEFELQSMRAAPWAYTVNEWRNQANRPAVENGDRHLLPLNQMLVDIAAGENVDNSNQGNDPADSEVVDGEGEAEAERAVEVGEFDVKTLVQTVLPTVRARFLDHVKNSRRANSGAGG